MVTLKKVGDWDRAGIILRGISLNLNSAFTARMEENSNLVLEKMRSHIDAQDLPWIPLTEHTIALKGGNDTILVETGRLRDGLKVEKVTSTALGATFFVGATGELGQLLVWIEYGTSKMPARPLVRPTYEEMSRILRDNWIDLLKRLMLRGK